MRPVVLGRKNWVHVGSLSVADASGPGVELVLGLAQTERGVRD